ncbi:MAG: L-aspartate oxidase, partial [Deltaproteobacteria bacterium]|nr:L-aspartate oxidase [Deltaproteobacteria bacterium]
PSEEDIPSLVKDTLIAGCHHNHVKAVRQLSQHGPEAVKEVLIDKLNIPFDKHADGSLDFTREGGHAINRIIHCADHTGKTIMEGMLRAVREHPQIEILQGRTAIDLITSQHQPTRMEFRYQLQNQCLGAYVLNDETGEVETCLADWTILATGGVGQVYLHTTNRTSANGSGIAMAYRAEVRLENMEYVQFHPTALFHRQSNRFLISESVRGEGGRLINSNGEYFMARYDERKDLAPRDIVARSIMSEMLKTGSECVYLDVSGIDMDLEERFPTIYGHCMDLGIDIRKEPIPVVPVAHYFCGGILTDINGRTTLDRLYAVGECACTGVHGANRLASTSLLEALLWGRSAGQNIVSRDTKKHRLGKRLQDSIPDWHMAGSAHNDDPALLALDWSTIRTIMWNYVGISRTRSRLKRAFEDLRAMSRRIHEFYSDTPLTKPIVDLFHGCQTAYIITQAALRNPNSLGCHYRRED